MNLSHLWMPAGAVLVVGGTVFAVSGGSAALAAPLRVELCDGATSIEIAGTPADAAQGRAVADRLMAEWQRRHPERAAIWQGSGTAQDPGRSSAVPDDPEALLQKRFQLDKPFDNRVLLGKGQGEDQPYGAFAERDIAIWERETYKLVLEGAQVFHDAGRLGSTIAVSCDMCHPDAANTHPETYPKYQTQIGKAVLLRDMINWCLEHPVRAPKMADDDPRMKAMEAYIFAQRAGKTLQFGRH